MSSSTEGEAFIKTSSLDGEKNLKKRNVPKGYDKLVPQGNEQLAIKELVAASGNLFVPKLPEKELTRFDGFIIEDGQQFSISDKQLLIKGASLQNTEWAVGIVAYVGESTKLMLNSQKGRVKMSYLERQINGLVLLIVAFQAVLCVINALCNAIWLAESEFDT